MRASATPLTVSGQSLLGFAVQGIKGSGYRFHCGIDPILQAPTWQSSGNPGKVACALGHSVMALTTGCTKCPTSMGMKNLKPHVWEIGSARISLTAMPVLKAVSIAYLHNQQELSLLLQDKRLQWCIDIGSKQKSTLNIQRGVLTYQVTCLQQGQELTSIAWPWQMRLSYSMSLPLPLQLMQEGLKVFVNKLPLQNQGLFNIH